MTFDPYYVGSQASQIGYGAVSRAAGRAGAGRRRKTMKKTAKKDRALATKAFVKRIIDSRIEDKTQSFDDVVNFAGYFANTDLSARYIGPDTSSYIIAQGSGQGDRVGNVIRVKKCILKYYLVPIPQDPSFNPVPQPQLVRVWVGNIRSNLAQKPDNVTIAELYQGGNNSFPPNETVDDMMAPVNADKFIEKYTCVHKVGHAIYTDPNSTLKPFSYYANNDYSESTFGMVDCTKFFKSRLYFNDSNQQTDSNLFMWMEAVNSDNTQYLNGPTVKMVYNIEFIYEDA